MGIDCMGMGGNGNVKKIHSRPSLLSRRLNRLRCTETVRPFPFNTYVTSAKAGTDGIPAEVLKKCSSCLLPHLVDLFEAIYINFISPKWQHDTRY